MGREDVVTWSSSSIGAWIGSGPVETRCGASSTPKGTGGGLRIFGKTFGDYLRFAAGIVALVVVVGVARLASSLAGVPVSSAKFMSGA